MTLGASAMVVVVDVAVDVDGAEDEEEATVGAVGVAASTFFFLDGRSLARLLVEDVGASWIDGCCC